MITVSLHRARTFAAACVLIAGVALVVVVLAGSSAQTTRGTGSGGAQKRVAPSPAWTFNDRAAGFSLTLPAGWRRLPDSDPQVALLAASPDRSLALLVRVTALGLPNRPVAVAQLPAFRSLADRLINSDPRVRLLLPPAEVDIHGLVGYAYVYTERVTPAAAPDAHIHYLLFDRGTLIALVFQLAHPAQLHSVAPALARIAGTLRVTQ
jgi:hypothetical protein